MTEIARGNMTWSPVPSAVFSLGTSGSLLVKQLLTCLLHACSWNANILCSPVYPLQARWQGFHGVGIDTSELLSGGPSPRVALETRSKECDYAWIASDLASMDSVPSVVLEVAVFNEDETELEAAGSEWMDLLQVQVGPSLWQYKSTTLVL
jgi:hypothetical protein